MGYPNISVIGEWPPDDWTGFFLIIANGQRVDRQFENDFILSSELSIQSKFDSTKFVELESGSSQPNESESVDFDSANLDISVLSRFSLSFSFEYVVKSLLP